MAVQTHQIIEVDCRFDSFDSEGILSHIEPLLGDDPNLPARISRVGQACLDLLSPRGVYRLFNPAICTLPPSYTEPGIKLVGTMAVLRGESVYGRLKKATHCAMLASTLGSSSAVEGLLNRFEPTGPDRVALSACMEFLSQRTCNMTNAAIVKDALERDLYTDDCLRPGEEDFPLEAQSLIAFYTQSEKRLGMKVSGDDLLPPGSRLGIVGLYDKSQKGRRRACGRCNYRDFCSIRAIGMTCHGRKGTFAKA